MTAPAPGLLFQLLQFLQEENHTHALHELERETGLFFNTKYFEELVVAGKWDEAENYLAGFTSIEDNGSSLKMYFEIRKQKYLEALDRKDHLAAIKILKKDLRIFQALNQEIFNELTMLLTLDDFRQNEKLAVYGDTANARALMLQELSSLAESNPALRDKMVFPQMPLGSLRATYAQSLQWQVAGGPAQRALPDLPKLANGQFRPRMDGVLPSLPASVPRAHYAEHPRAAQPQAAIPRPAAVALPQLPAQPKGVSRTKRPAETADDASAPKRPRIAPVTEAMDLPMHTARVVSLPSEGTSCDFHPFLHSLLLAGTATGQVLLWSLPNRECLLELRCASKLLTESVAVNRIVWGPEGNMFGVAFAATKAKVGVIHIYRWTAENTKVAESRVEINAHENGVQDLSLTSLDGVPVAVSGGSDCLVKVWDATTGGIMFKFTGHEGPVYSVCPHMKGNISFVFSTGRDGRIKAWLYDSQVAAVVDYSAAGSWWTHMAYSANGARLFSCGVSTGADSTLVEWNESDGAIARRFTGFSNSTGSLTRFDTANNKYLIVGDDHSIKVWEMDKPDVLMWLPLQRSELPAHPLVRINKPASLMAVSTANNSLMILANPAGAQLLGKLQPPPEPTPVEPASAPGPPAAVGSSSSAPKQADSQPPAAAQPDLASAPSEAGVSSLASREHCVVTDIETGATEAGNGVQRLVFASSGTELLGAMHSGATYLWTRSKDSPAAEAGGRWKSSGPRFAAPREQMQTGASPTRCLAISRNNSYMLSANGGKVSLHNLINFKEITTFQKPPPAATAVAFHPQDNNVIALGLDDAVVAIYNVRLDVVQQSKRCHEGFISGLAFAGNGKHLVSAGSDAVVCFWAVATEGDGKLIALRTARLQPAYAGGPRPADKVAMHVHAHTSGAHVLCQHPQQLVMYAVATGARQAVWAPHAGSAFEEQRLVAATFTADGRQVIAAFDSGALGVFEGSNLKLLRYVDHAVLDPSRAVRPTALAAQPQGPRIAVGCSNGSVLLLEPAGGCSWEKTGLSSSASAEGSRLKQEGGSPAEGVADAPGKSPASDQAQADAPADGGSGSAGARGS